MDVNGQRSGSIQSVERAVAVLKLFGEAEPELGVSELARRLKLHKSTVSRLLSTLEAGGFVQQDPRNGRYRLGLQLATLAGLALTQYELRDVARPMLQDLAAQSGETTTLSVLDGMEAVNIDQVLAPHPVKHLGWIGRRLPLHCTAAGKPILAHLPHSTQDRYLARPLLRFTARTVTNPDLVRRELEAIRARGFAVAREEYEAELCAVGAPVLDHRGDVVASITVSGPTYRLPPGRLLELGEAVRLAAGRISAQLGHRPAGAAVLAGGQRAGASPPPPGPDAEAARPAGDGPPSQRRGGGVHKTDGRRPAVGLAGPVFGD
jgi:IclR family transcriptional regulator, acetate operon repressor